MARSLRLTEEQLASLLRTSVSWQRSIRQALLRRNQSASRIAPNARKPKQPEGHGQEPQKRATARIRGKAGRSEAEEQLAFQIRAAKLPEPVRQWRFAPPRRFRADFGWPFGDYNPNKPLRAVAVEVEGGVWMRGKSGHSSGTGILQDMAKANEYALRGIRCLRVTPEHVKSGQALALIERLLSQS